MLFSILNRTTIEQTLELSVIWDTLTLMLRHSYGATRVWCKWMYMMTSSNGNIFRVTGPVNMENNSSVFFIKILDVSRIKSLISLAD